MKQKNNFKYRQIFCDWHMPDFLPEIRIDYDDYFQRIKESGAQTLVFMAKSAHGNCLFPSKVGFTNKVMKGDIFGEVARRAKKMGIQFIAYYNMVLNNRLAKVHPEWRQVDKDHKPVKMFRYETFCMSNDLFTDYTARHMEEIARLYDIDGFFLDLQYFAPEACFCSACRAKFKQVYRRELRFDLLKTPAHWLDFYSFQADMREKFILAAKHRCDAVNHRLLWSWNGCGNPSAISNTLGNEADYLSTEAHAPHYLDCFLRSGFCAASGKPFALFMPECQSGWGEWTLTTLNTMKGFSAIALAHGGALNLNQVPVPAGDYAGQIFRPVWQTARDTMRWVRKRSAVCHNKKSVPVIACLHSAMNMRMGAAFARCGEDLAVVNADAIHDAELMLTQILSENHLPCDMLLAGSQLDRLGDYELVVLPLMPFVDNLLAEKLRNYVANGGKLLATHMTSLFDEKGRRLDNFALADLFGVNLASVSPYSVSYIDRLNTLFPATLRQMPQLIKAEGHGLNPPYRALYCHPQGSARILGYVADPMIESDFSSGHFIYHEHSPVGTSTDYPAIISNKYGKGTVLYLSVPFFPAYLARRSPFLKDMLNLLITRELGVSRRVRIAAPPSVHAVLRQDETGWFLHLIHIQKETDSVYLDGFERRGPIQVMVKPGWTVRKVVKCLDNIILPHKIAAGRTSFLIESARDHEIYFIKK